MVMLQNMVAPVRRKRKRQSAISSSILSTILESSVGSAFSPGACVLCVCVCVCVCSAVCVLVYTYLLCI